MKRAVSFNGGKESLIILYQNLLDIQAGKTLVFRIKEVNEFSEIEEYIEKIKREYGINIIEFSDVKESIKILKKEYDVEIVILPCLNFEQLEERVNGDKSTLEYIVKGLLSLI